MCTTLIFFVTDNYTICIPRLITVYLCSVPMYNILKSCISYSACSTLRTPGIISQNMPNLLSYHMRWNRFLLLCCHQIICDHAMLVKTWGSRGNNPSNWRSRSELISHSYPNWKVDDSNPNLCLLFSFFLFLLA